MSFWLVFLEHLEAICERPARRGDTAQRRSRRKNKGGPSEGGRKSKYKTDNPEASPSPSQRKEQGASPSGKVRVTAQIEDHRDDGDNQNNQS